MEPWTEIQVCRGCLLRDWSRAKCWSRLYTEPGLGLRWPAATRAQGTHQGTSDVGSAMLLHLHKFRRASTCEESAGTEASAYGVSRGWTGQVICAAWVFLFACAKRWFQTQQWSVGIKEKLAGGEMKAWRSTCLHRGMEWCREARNAEEAPQTSCHCMSWSLG